MTARRKQLRNMARGPDRRMHRIATVRQERGLALDEIARLLNVEVDELKQEEDERSDLWLSHLYRWQQALNVPVEDLLVEGDPAISAPEIERAQLARLIETATSVLHSANDRRVKSIARMFITQIIEIMPELNARTPVLPDEPADDAKSPAGPLLPRPNRDL